MSKIPKFTPQWRKDNRKVIVGTVIVAALLLLFGLYRIFYGRPAKEMFKDDSILKADLKAIRKQNDSLGKHITVLYQRIDHDSVRLVSIEGQLRNLPAVLNQINNQFNEKRAAYTALPFDKRFMLFAGLISQIDTASK